MKANVSAPLLNENKKKPNVFLIFLLGFLLLGAIGLGLYTIMTQQLSTKSRAEEAATDPAAVVETATPTQAAEVTGPTPESSPSVETVTPTVAVTVTESLPLVEAVTPTVAQTATESATAEPTVAPTQALVSALSCPANGASCAWDVVNGATSYNVTIVDRTTSDVVTTQTTSGTSINFTAIIEHTYECSVQAVNNCGTSGAAKGENTCRSNVTPTPPSSTSTPGPSATPTVGPSATPGQGPSATPQSGQPGPTIPTAGSSSTVYFMIISTILVAALFLVF